MKPRSLVSVRTPDIVQLLRLVHRGSLPCPITPIGLATSGLLRLLDDVDLLDGLDERATRAVLTGILAERRVTLGKAPPVVIPPETLT